MVPAVLAISGVSAHARSHHRGCRVSQSVQVSGRGTTPTCATGGPLSGASDYLPSMLLLIARILVWCNQNPLLFCSPSRRSSPPASPGLSLSTRDSEEPASSHPKLHNSLQRLAAQICVPRAETPCGNDPITRPWRL